MGAVSFSIDPKLASSLQSALNSEFFFESGGFEGDSVANVVSYFQRLITVELSPHYAALLRERFAGAAKIEVVEDDSAAALASLKERLRSRRVLYWLDAHWCNADSVATQTHQCPLLDELRAIGTLNEYSAIVIDDARLFLSPPPDSHRRAEWPSWTEINQQISALSGLTHQSMVLNDCIIIYPHSVSNEVLDFARKHGVDWLKIADLAREHPVMATAAADRLQLIESLNASATSANAESTRLRVEVAQLRVSLEERELALRGTHETAVARGEELLRLAKELESLQSELRAKEKVINEVNRARIDLENETQTYKQRLEANETAATLVERQRIELSDRVGVMSRLHDEATNALNDSMRLTEFMATASRSSAAATQALNSQLQLHQTAEAHLLQLVSKFNTELLRTRELADSVSEIATDFRAELEAKAEAIKLSAIHLEEPVIRGKMSASRASQLLLENAVKAQIKLVEEKEVVIHELAGAVAAYRAALAKPPPIHQRAYKAAKARFAATKQRVKALTTPKLGVLYQHSPIPFEPPRASYVSALNDVDLPTISIVTPSFRQAHLIERTIKSVVDQAYPRLQYHVQDGGSVDGTVDVLKKWDAQLSSWESKKDGGQSAAINLGFARTNGELMAWLNSDDVLMPGALHFVADFFKRNPDVDVVYGDRLLIDEADKLIGRWVLPGHDDEVLKWADFVPQETMFWRRRIWDKVGGIDESFRFAMDWDLLLRFRKVGAKIVHRPVYLGAFRIHEAQKTSAVINEVGFQEMTRLRVRELGREVTHDEIRRAIAPFMLKHIFVDKLRHRRLGV